MNKHEELRKEFNEKFPYADGRSSTFRKIAEFWIAKIDQIEKVSYKKGYEDGLKQGMFDEEMNKINTQLK